MQTEWQCQCECQKAKRKHLIFLLYVVVASIAFIITAWVAFFYETTNLWRPYTSSFKIHQQGERTSPVLPSSQSDTETWLFLLGSVDTVRVVVCVQRERERESTELLLNPVKLSMPSLEKHGKLLYHCKLLILDKFSFCHVILFQTFADGYKVLNNCSQRWGNHIPTLPMLYLFVYYIFMTC